MQLWPVWILATELHSHHVATAYIVFGHIGMASAVFVHTALANVVSAYIFNGTCSHGLRRHGLLFLGGRSADAPHAADVVELDVRGERVCVRRSTLTLCKVAIAI